MSHDMQMPLLKRLMGGVGRIFSRDLKEAPLMTLSGGVYALLTVTEDAIHFHNTKYRPDMPVKQTVEFDGMTVSDLRVLLAGMGYAATLSEDALTKGWGGYQAFSLLEVRDLPLSPAATLMTATTNNWGLLYPLYRLLKQADGDIEVAIKQMCLPTARGKWLDYWAMLSGGIRRTSSEDDDALLRRMLMNLRNPQTNNFAMAEAIGFQLGTRAEVNDVSPLLFEVLFTPEFIPRNSETIALIEQIKGAAIEYVIRYKSAFTEDYRASFADQNGSDFKNADSMYVQAGFTENDYGRSATGEYLLKDDYFMAALMTYAEIYATIQEESSSLAIATLSDMFGLPKDAITSSAILSTSEGAYGWTSDGFTLGDDELGTDGRGLFGRTTAEVVTMTMTNIYTNTVVRTGTY